MITPYSNIISVTTLEALLLDTYSGAAAAYSLRKLSASYTGSAIRVRRASDNTEQDIGFVGEDLNTSALTTFCSGTNGFVKTWYDQSGNGNDATQTTAANQPQIVSSGSVILENGKPVINSDGINDRYAIPLINLSNDYNIIILSALKDFLTNMWIGKSDTDGYIWAQDGQNNGFIVRHDGETGGANFTGIKTLNQELHLFQRYGTTMAHSRNGVNTIVTERSVQGVNFGINVILDGYLPSSGYAINAKTQEIIIYPSDQSSNRTGIETNINANYQIYWDGSQTSLLDTYGGSAAAYSLRALSSAYTGPLVRVRRASDNAEQDIYAKYDGTLNVSALESFCSGTNGFVKTWYDQSGNGYDATQATASDQPQIVSSGSVILENLNPALNFDGVNNILLYNGEILNQSSWLAFCVIKNNKISAVGRIFDQSNINGGALYSNSPTNVAGLFYTTTAGNRELMDNQFYTTQVLQVGQALSGNSKLRINAVDRATNSNTFTMSGNTGLNFVIGDNSPPAGQKIDANLQELIIYTTNNNSNISGIETNINNFYSIY